MVSAAKLRRAQDKIVQMRPYSQKLTNILNNVSASSEGAGDIAYAQKREGKKVLLVPVTSDKGLCGAFNTNIIKATIAAIKEQFAGSEITIMPLGKKSFEYFKKSSYSVIDSHYLLFQNLTFEEVRNAAELAMNGFVAGEYDQGYLIFNELKNVGKQLVRTETVLTNGSTGNQRSKESRDRLHFRTIKILYH